MSIRIGSHVIYVRMERGTDKQLKPVSYQATLLGQEAAEDGKDGAARLVFVHPGKLSHLNGADWARAFEYAEQVPFEPEGEFFHGFSEPQRLSDNSISAVFGKLDAKADQIADLQQSNSILVEHVAQLTAKLAEMKGKPSAADLD